MRDGIIAHFRLTHFAPFTGQDIETNTALPYADITDPQTLNKYAYVKNNPLRYVDPDGHFPWALPLIPEGLAGMGWVAGAVGATGLAVTLNRYSDEISEAIHSTGRAVTQILQDASANASPGLGLTPGFATSFKTGTGETSAGEQRKGPVKAKDAPGVTAGGQATDKFGNKLGPNGETQVNQTTSNTREAARNKALNEGSGATNHANPARGKPHFHPTDAKGDKKPNSTHHNYPD